jgi:hypothetical protein
MQVEVNPLPFPRRSLEIAAPSTSGSTTVGGSCVALRLNVLVPVIGARRGVALVQPWAIIGSRSCPRSAQVHKNGAARYEGW